MQLLPFTRSADNTFGIELELQIIDPENYQMTSKSKELIRLIQPSQYQALIKPEMTQSMVEINSSIHMHPDNMLSELMAIQAFLLDHANNLNIFLAGGGTHPFQNWMGEKIFPSLRYKHISRLYQYLSKRATFGLHVHVGCQNPNDALYLTHALSRYVPQFIALSGSSPFYQGVDTGYHSSRLTVFNSFPLCGVIPFLENWEDFSKYYFMMQSLGIIESMKDFYWDIRPKPEFGTVEVRVCDTPLALKKAVMIGAYIHALAHYLLDQRPNPITQKMYHIYNHNRFQANRFGINGIIVNADTQTQVTIQADLAATYEHIMPYALSLKSNHFIEPLINDALKNNNDAEYLRQIYKQTSNMTDVVRHICEVWSGETLALAQ
jgi:glutamate---cysteine ligase / carboxylate-amine ligase